MTDKKDLNLPVVDEAEFTQSFRGNSKGGPRKLKESVREIVEELGANPVARLVQILNNDHEALGFKDPFKIVYNKDGDPVGETPNITPELVHQAAKTLMEYIFSKKFVVGGDGGSPIKFEGKAEVDYTKLAKMIKAAKGEE